MTDRWIVLVALGVGFGAWKATPVPTLLIVTVAGFVLVTRHGLPLCILGALVASLLGARSLNGLPSTLGNREVRAVEVILLTDPVNTLSGTRVEAKLGSHRVQLWARGKLGSEVDRHHAGEKALVDGRLQLVTGLAKDYLTSRHIALRLETKSIISWKRADMASAAANSFRSLVFDGARSLPRVERSLFAGFVLGDTHDQSADIADSFSASGLTHLMAVSGENVAFVLVAAGPLVRVLRRRGRFVLTLLVLAFFCVATRWQPSVLRAAGMAAVGAWATLRGRSASGVRILAVTVIFLTLIDPLLIRSPGFLLSVGASGGIILWGHRVSQSVPGPRVLAEAIGVTIAAQLGTLPLLLTLFGGVPVASVPANALAVPAAGPVMVWGLTGGVIAGVVGGRVAWALHLVDHALLWWVSVIARNAARWNMGNLELRHIVLIGLAAVAWRQRVRATRLWHRRLIVAFTIAASVTPVVDAGRLLSSDHRGEFVVAGKSRVTLGRGSAVLVLGFSEPKTVLADLRSRGITSVDMVIVSGATRASFDAAEPVIRQLEPSLVVGPSTTQRIGIHAAVEGEQWRLGSCTVTVTQASPHLAVTVVDDENAALLGQPSEPLTPDTG